MPAQCSTSIFNKFQQKCQDFSCLVSNAAAAQAVDIPGVQVTKILAALGTVVHIRLQAKVALALALHPVIVGLPRLVAIMTVLQVRQDLGLAPFQVAVPSRPQTAMTAG
jgi:hypothetical protein